MADVQRDDLGDRRHRPHGVEGEAVAGVDLEAERRARPRGLRKPRQLLGPPRAGGVAVGARVKLHGRGADGAGRLDLLPFRIDEEGDADSGLAERGDEGLERPRGGGDVEPALGGELPALLGNEAHRVRPDAERDRAHLVRDGHLQVEGDVEVARQALHVLVADVAPVLAQMHGDSVRPRLGGEPRGAQRVGIGSAPRVAQRCDVVDVDAQAQPAAHRAALFSCATAPIARLSAVRLRRMSWTRWIANLAGQYTTTHTKAADGALPNAHGRRVCIA